jgi:general secretion pathway protein F
MYERIQGELNVPVTEHDLQNDKLTTAHQADINYPCVGADKKTYERDILRRIGTKDVCRLARQLAMLLQAGMPLVPALSALVEHLQDDPLAEIMQEVRNNVNAGITLADSLGKHPRIFSSLFVNMVVAGEASGTLEEVLLRLSKMLEKRIYLANKVKSALAYPLMMIVVAVGVVVFLLSFVVPSITQIFLEINRTLPWPTRLLIGISTFTKTYLVLITIVVCAICMGINRYIRTREGRLIWDRSKLKLPLLGKLFLKLEIARVARTLGTLFASGIPILSALEITKGVVQNSLIADTLDSVKDMVSKGDTFAGAIKKTGLFPPIVFHIIATGQISGDMETSLLNVSEIYDGEVEMAAKTLTSLLEPAILLVMGAIIGFIVLAILLPIFEINQAL